MLDQIKKYEERIKKRKDSIENLEKKLKDEKTKLKQEEKNLMHKKYAEVLRAMQENGVSPDEALKAMDLDSTNAENNNQYKGV